MQKQPIKHFIREWRELRGLTQRELAERIPFTNAAISQLETGWTRYRQEMLESLADALGCAPEDLLRPPHEAEFIRFVSKLPNEQFGCLVAIIQIVLKSWGVSYPDEGLPEVD